jgi:hypothetical protein
MNDRKSLAFVASILILVTLILSCNQISDESNRIEYVININEVKPDDKVYFSQLLSEKYTFIPLETDSNILIGGIAKASVINDNLLILDSKFSKSLYLFDLNGKFINKFGEVGKGPGQFLQPLDFTFDSESQKLFVLDAGLKVFTYEMNGKFISTIDLSLKKISAFKFEKTPVGFALIAGGTDFNLLLTNNNFDIISHHFPYTVRDLEYVMINPINRVSDSLVTYRRNLNDTLFSLGEQLSPHVFINTGNTISISNSSLNSTVSIEMINLLRSRTATIVHGYFENTAHIVLGAAIKGEPHYLFYNKKSKNISLVPFANFSDDITYGDFINIVGMSGDSFIIQIDPAVILNGIESWDINNTNIEYKFLEGVTENSNPIILIAKLNI